ncbi:MAG TPA: uracil-DNA glycosylase, partial [Nitrososphaerales archaeon]|nr:uracil-DNA glycosylase [Nitrososphaerales archaeon]
YASQEYWRKPVPGYGDLSGRVLILGLAPASQGGNRTGRIFTGDASSRFLVKALYAAGFANQPISESRDDGLRYSDCYVTAALKCSPPGDKPTSREFANCSPFLAQEISLLVNVRAVIALGALAFRSYLDYLGGRGVNVRGMGFSHGKSYSFEGMPRLYASYHPSPRNTNTGKLTQQMMVGLFKKVRRELPQIEQMVRYGRPVGEDPSGRNA